MLESKQFQAAKAAASQLELAAQEAGVIEKKKSSQPVRGTEAWDDAMIKARGQAERYVRALPANEPNPPFLLVVDVGHSLRGVRRLHPGRQSLPAVSRPAHLSHPAGAPRRREDPRTAAAHLDQPRGARPRARSPPTSPAKISAHLAELAKSLEEAGHEPRRRSRDFLTRCLFCMFAEDVGLLPERGFTELLNSLPARRQRASRK